MKNKKAHVTLSGEIITKETPVIGCVDKDYLERIKRQEKKLKELLSGKTKKQVLFIKCYKKWGKPAFESFSESYN